MTTALDRLLAAIPDDGPTPREAQLALVRELLGRGRGSRPGAAPEASIPGEPPETTGVPPAAASAEQPLAWTCGNCGIEWPEPYCDFCGRSLATLSYDRRQEQALDGPSAPAGRKEHGSNEH